MWRIVHWHITFKVSTNELNSSNSLWYLSESWLSCFLIYQLISFWWGTKDLLWNLWMFFSFDSNGFILSMWYIKFSIDGITGIHIFVDIFMTGICWSRLWNECFVVWLDLSSAIKINGIRSDMGKIEMNEIQVISKITV